MSESGGDDVILVDEGPQKRSKASFDSTADYASYSVCYERKPQLQEQEGLRTMRDDKGRHWTIRDHLEVQHLAGSNQTRTCWRVAAWAAAISQSLVADFLGGGAAAAFHISDVANLEIRAARASAG